MNKFNILLICFLIYLFTVMLMILFIPYIKKIKLGQEIRKEGPKKHLTKKGTPTMGGLIIVITTIFIYFFIKIYLKSALTVDDFFLFFPFLGFGLIGFIDDFLSIKRHENTGLTPTKKFILELFVCALYYFSYLGLGFNNKLNFFGVYIDLSFLYGVLIIILMAGFTNATNFTDGIDGLLACSSITSFICLGLYAYLINYFDVTLICLIIVMVLLGFLTFNLNIALVFMGDTGSLAIGGLMVSLLIYMHSEVLIIFFGFVYLVEILSVILQVWFFRRSHGDRIFKMTPLHHHFELCGMSENKIDLIFSIISLTFSILGIYIGVKLL